MLSPTASDELQRPESTVVEPKQIRVILPLADKDRQVPVLQKIPVIHESPGNHDTAAEALL